VKRGALIVGNGGTAGSISGDVTVDAGATFGINKSDQYMLINQISGAGGFAQLGSGTTIFASNFIDYTGTTTIAAGTLQVGNGGSEGSIGTGDILNNATLAINLGGISPFVLPNNISGTGKLEQIGPGTTQLTGTNTYSGATNVNAGTLQAGAANTFSPNSTHNVLPGAVLDLDNFNQTIGALSGEGGVTLGSGSLDTGGNNASTTFAGVIAGSGGLTKSGTGTFTLTGANLYGGGTTLAAGVLSVSADANLGAAAGALSFNGGTLQVTGTAFNTTARAVNWSPSGGTFDIVAAGNSFAVVSTIGAGGALTKIGAGTLVLGGATSYAGATSVNAGTLQAGGTNVFSGSSAFTVASGATLNFAGFNQTIGSLAGAGAVGLGAGVLTTGGDNTSTTFAGVASGSGGLTKAGTGTFTLTGSNTHTGTTTVNAGTLSVNGAIAGPVTVNSGATLGGTGTIGSTTVNNGGVFAPGNSIGTISVNGNLVLGAGSIYRVELSPTSSDRTNVTGSATLGGTAQLVFGPGSYAQHSYTILSAAGGRIGTFENVAVEGLPAALTASLSYTSTDVLLATLTSQIEPVLPKFLSGVTPNQRSRPRRTRLSTARCRRSRRCTISRSRSFPPRSMRFPARCTPARSACSRTRACTYARRSWDGCARPRTAATPAWHRSRSAARRPRSPTRRSTRRSPTPSRRSSPRRP
jgi:autotransporter-associated beta strand protein